MNKVELEMNEETNLSDLFKEHPQDRALEFDAENFRVILWHPDRPKAHIHVLSFDFCKGNWELTPRTLDKDEGADLYELLLSKHLLDMRIIIDRLESKVRNLNHMVPQSKKPTPPDDLPL